MNNISQPSTHKYLLLLVMLYITFDLCSLVYSYKEIQFGLIVGMASSIIFPITYLIIDVATEIYGYKVAKSVILYGILCDFIFATIVYTITFVPSPNTDQNAAYILVLRPLLRAITAQTIGITIGGFTNIYCMSKWKAILNGKHFWFRSIGSSAIGEALALIISVFVALGGILPLNTLLHIILYAYIYKILFAILIVPFGSLATYLLKTKVDRNIYEVTNLNPFQLNY